MKDTQLGQKDGALKASAEGSAKVLKLVPRRLVDLSNQEEESLDLSRFFSYNNFRIRDKIATAKTVLKIALKECEDGLDIVNGKLRKKQQNKMPFPLVFFEEAASYISLTFDILTVLEHESEEFQNAMLRRLIAFESALSRGQEE
jgi:hypothetical protein